MVFSTQGTQLQAVARTLSAHTVARHFLHTTVASTLPAHAVAHTFCSTRSSSLHFAAHTVFRTLSFHTQLFIHFPAPTAAHTFGNIHKSCSYTSYTQQTVDHIIRILRSHTRATNATRVRNLTVHYDSSRGLWTMKNALCSLRGAHRTNNRFPLRHLRILGPIDSWYV